MFIFIILPLPTLSRGFHKSRAGWKLWLSQGRNRDTGLILPRVLFFSVALDAKKPRLQAKNLESEASFYTLFCSIFEELKKPEGEFLLLELGKFGVSLNKFV